MLMHDDSAGAMGGGISSAIAVRSAAVAATRRTLWCCTPSSSTIVLVFAFSAVCLLRPAIYHALGGAGGELEGPSSINVVFAALCCSGHERPRQRNPPDRNMMVPRS